MRAAPLLPAAGTGVIPPRARRGAGSTGSRPAHGAGSALLFSYSYLKDRAGRTALHAHRRREGAPPLQPPRGPRAPAPPSGARGRHGRPRAQL